LFRARRIVDQRLISLFIQKGAPQAIKACIAFYLVKWKSLLKWN
jgi:hypothetical protein